MIKEAFSQLWQSTGLLGFISEGGWGNLVMILVGFALLYLAIKKGFEPLLLIPIGFGCILSNIPMAFIAGIDDGGTVGFIKLLYDMGIETGLFPILIFMGVGAMTDFGPLIANPKTLLLGAAAQLGIFVALIGALAISFIPGINFDMHAAASIGIIGGADGPTAIYVTSRLAPDLLGSIAVAAYSYMALVPIIQPPIMRLLTTPHERRIRMLQEREVSRLERLLFPILILLVCIVFLPAALPLMGSLALGNFIRECGAVERLSHAMQNEIMNVATILLGLGVVMQLDAVKFLRPATLGIISIGLMAFALGTAGGVVFAKVMNLFSPRNPINPLIGSAGVSAFPMAARVSTRLALEYDPQNVLLMHAMGANVAGQIGSIVAGGVILALFS